MRKTTVFVMRPQLISTSKRSNNPFLRYRGACWNLGAYSVRALIRIGVFINKKQNRGGHLPERGRLLEQGR